MEAITKKVNSTFIEKIRFSETASGETACDVFMKGGRNYRYYGVTKNLFTRFAKAKSTGRYYGNKIKGQFEMRRLSCS